MDQGRLRGAHRLRVAHEPIDLGNEPPLSVDGESGGPIDRRRVSIQWFSGTILTGVCGAALMGGAVFAALDGEATFARTPDRFEGLLRSGIGSIGPTAIRKGDRLSLYAEPSVSRHVIRVSTIARAGDREIVQVRPFVRVAGNLSLAVTEISSKIAPFNAQRLLAESVPNPAAAADNSSSGAAPNADVSFVTRDLAPLLRHARITQTVPIHQVLANVREAAKATGMVPGRPIFGLAGTTLAYAAEGAPDPYAGINARIVPENVTLLPKTKSQTTGGNPWNEHVVAVKTGDSVVAILQSLGASKEDSQAAAAALGARGHSGALKDGQKLRVLLSPNDGGQQLKPVRVIVADDGGVEAIAAFSDAGRYVAVDVQSAKDVVADAGEAPEDDGSGVRLYQSIYETALRDQVPRPAVDELIRIYSFDVDFQRRVQPGDSFEILYAGDDENGSAEAKPDVMFASLTLNGETKKFYRFLTPDDGIVDYYDEAGNSAKKFLVRKPLTAGIMRSGFGFRRHPIMRYVKMHTGVDWSAPHGTPIYAAGNGTVEKAGWESGYGKYIRIKHNNGYETAYGHMTAFAKGIDEGSKVRQGQIIGFVGSTGLSTGSHLHYEILINGRFVDPMRIRLPRGRTLKGGILAGFEQERDRIDDMMTRAPMRTAQSQTR